MYIKNLVLKNFRNYNFIDINFNKNLNIFIGDNGQGKTNVLESIFLSSFGQSFRTRKDKDLINFKSDATYVKLEIEKENFDVEIEIKIKDNLKKEIKVNGNNLFKRSDLFGNFNVVIFSPEDLKLIKEGPSERRKFIDREISNIKKSYCNNLIEYHRILNQRNSLLKSSRYKKSLIDTIDIWNQKLTEVGTKIILEKKKFTDKLNYESNRLHLNFTENKENINIKYLSNIKINEFEYDKIYREFINRLEKNLKGDIEKGFTSVGPHRDDIDITINGREAKIFGSQGQQRTAALSIKLSQINIIYEEIGEYPVLLLDDVMSELDIKRQNDLIKYLINIQTIITLTDTGSIMKNYLKKSKIFNVKEGNVSSVD